MIKLQVCYNALVVFVRREDLAHLTFMLCLVFVSPAESLEGGILTNDHCAELFSNSLFNREF